MDLEQVAEGLTAGESAKSIAARIAKSYQSVYREIACNRSLMVNINPGTPTGKRMSGGDIRDRRVVLDDQLRAIAASRLAEHWSPAQISRWLWNQRTNWRLCHETIYQATYRRLIVPSGVQTLRTGPDASTTGVAPAAAC